MKKILIILTSALVFGCSEDYLEKYPTTSMVIENYYKTPSDATQAITAIYNMNLFDDWWCSYVLSEIASDDCAGGAGQGDGGGFQRWDRCIAQPDATTNEILWNTYWGAIYRANIYIQYESRIDWTGKESLQKQYLAEARFLRAYFHFYLSRLFGEIPAVDHPLAPGEYPVRTPAEDLYSFMMEDLKYAAQNALSAKYGEMEPANWGHITKWAAESMIARVYLFYSGYYNDETIKDFTVSDAKTYIDDVISNSGHGLVSDFAGLWKVPSLSTSVDYAGEVNKEVVWAIRFESSGNPSQVFHRMIGPRYTNIDPYGQGWGAMTVLKTLWNAYDAADKRRTATILSWDDEGLTYDWNSTSITQAQYTGYNCKKYELVSVGNTLPATNWQSDIDEDVIMIRYADVLLMGAEIHLLAGDNTNVVEWTNLVRERAFGDITHNYTTVTIDDIFNERRLELACEGLRYWDVLRSCKGDFSKLTSKLTYVDETDVDANGNNVDNSQTSDVYSLDVDGNNFVKTKGLFQIPPSQIDLMNGAIEQNPGYE